MAGRYTFVIIDDHPLICRGITNLIEQQPDWRILATAGSLADGRAALKSHRPDVAIFDLGLPDGSGMELLRECPEISPETKVIVSSMRDEGLFAPRCIQKGASGYVSKHRTDDTLIVAIETILRGEIYLSDELTSIDKRSKGTERGPYAVLDKLSARELLVFELIGSGKTTKQIADQLGVRPKTVDSYRERMKHKLSIDSSPGLTQFAAQWLFSIQ